MIMLRPNAKYAVEIDNTQEPAAAMRRPASCLTPNHSTQPSVRTRTRIFKPRMRALLEDSLRRTSQGRTCTRVLRRL